MPAAGPLPLYLLLVALALIAPACEQPMERPMGNPAAAWSYRLRREPQARTLRSTPFCLLAACGLGRFPHEPHGQQSSLSSIGDERVGLQEAAVTAPPRRRLLLGGEARPGAAGTPLNRQGLWSRRRVLHCLPLRGAGPLCC